MNFIEKFSIRIIEIQVEYQMTFNKSTQMVEESEFI